MGIGSTGGLNLYLARVTRVLSGRRDDCEACQCSLNLPGSIHVKGNASEFIGYV